ncbi:hypothetical protein BCR34DRAFT_607714 [Clohesyomyces aquaticus]|uniref:RING-type domain-containing protein n=1 Tax=Clohesyomyces aquaticus TaxID=1231657 RepID=A0A1Y1YDZ1_9PLEO|nr:hypothetical protein BCR34DRAFT_607714 [Clohesyomyces aquaticus]
MGSSISRTSLRRDVPHEVRLRAGDVLRRLDAVTPEVERLEVATPLDMNSRADRMTVGFLSFLMAICRGIRCEQGSDRDVLIAAGLGKFEVVVKWYEKVGYNGLQTQLQILASLPIQRLTHHEVLIKYIASSPRGNPIEILEKALERSQGFRQLLSPDIVLSDLDDPEDDEFATIFNPDEVYRRLGIQRTSDLSKEACPVCDEVKNTPMTRAPCDHQFCNQCLWEWVNSQATYLGARKYTCPFCRVCLVCGSHQCTHKAVRRLYFNHFALLEVLKWIQGNHGGVFNGWSLDEIVILREETRAARRKISVLSHLSIEGSQNDDLIVECVLQIKNRIAVAIQRRQEPADTVRVRRQLNPSGRIVFE